MEHRILGSSIPNDQGSIDIKSIVDVNPVRYDGLQDCLVVCAQKVAQYMCIHVLTGNNEHINLLLPCNGQTCENTYLLADAIIG